MAKEELKKLNLKISKDKLKELNDYLNDLIKINESLRLKIDSNTFLLYTIATLSGGEASNTFVACKYYYLNTADFFTGFEINETLDWIIVDTKKLIKRLSFFQNDSEININYLSKNSIISSVIFSDGNLKITQTGGEKNELKNITYNVISERLNPELIEFSLSIPSEEFNKIFKLSKLENENDIIRVDIKQGEVYFKESQWELYLGKVDYKDSSWLFDKKFLHNMDQEEGYINLNFFESFITNQTKINTLLVALEITDF